MEQYLRVGLNVYFCRACSVKACHGLKAASSERPFSSAVVDGLLSAKEKQTKVWDFPGEREVFPDMQCSKKRENIFCALVKTTKIKAEILLNSRITYRLICFSWILFGIK